MKEDAWQRLKNKFRARYEGRSNAGSTMILEGGMKFNRISVNPEEAQFLETRKYQTEEIARFYRVPLHLIQNLEKVNVFQHRTADDRLLSEYDAAVVRALGTVYEYALFNAAAAAGRLLL